MPIPLLHEWSGPAEKTNKGLFQIGSDGRTIPAIWELKPTACEPEAFPTPFARAEATELVLKHVESASQHRLNTEFKWLVLGVASGVLSLEPRDLLSEAYDNLGRALCQVDPNAQYFCQMTHKQLVYGMTYRTCLAWGHARRGDGDWTALAQAVLPVHGEALQVLADWRETLRRGNRWSPQTIAWQRGIDEVVGNQAPSEGLRELRENAAMVGPIWLDLPSGQLGVVAKTEPVYFPAYAPGFAGKFLSLLALAPTNTEGSIEFRDGRGTVLASIRRPAGGHASNLLALGSGRVDLRDATRVVQQSARIHVEGAGGLLELLEQLKLTIERYGRPVAGASEAIDASPYLYPDAIRLLLRVRRNIFDPPSADGATVVLTQRAQAKIIGAGQSIPDPSDVKESEGTSAVVSHDGRKTHLLVLDRLGGLEIGDLRALGYVLFRVFVGEATVHPELAGNLGDDELVPLLMHEAGRPLEPQPKIYDRVIGGPPGDDLARRLATLQRFVRAYTTSSPGIHKLLARAAGSFADWANGGVTVDALGRTSREALTYRLPLGIELRLPKDSLSSPRGGTA